MCFLIITFTIIGTILYVNNCKTYFTPDCYSTPINCEVKDHFIYDTECSNDDDDSVYNCYELIIECINNNYYCDATAGYYQSYMDAEEYFQEHYYHNETVMAYILDNNQTCTFSNPNPHPYEGIFGFYSLIFSIILTIIIMIIICFFVVINRRNMSINEPLLYEPYLSIPQKYTEEPPKYQ
jgi:hypothetical protein